MRMMVDCTQFFSGYTEYRDGVLDADRMHAFEVHLRHCPSCARYDRVVSGGVEVIHSLPEIEPSGDFVARLERRLRLEESPSRFSDGTASGASVAVMLAIVTAIGAMAWTPLARPRTAVVQLAPVVAHAPLQVEAVHDLFSTGPLLVRGSGSTGARQAAPTLLFRYSPLGSDTQVPVFPAVHAH